MELLTSLGCTAPVSHLHNFPKQSDDGLPPINHSTSHHHYFVENNEINSYYNVNQSKHNKIKPDETHKLQCKKHAFIHLSSSSLSLSSIPPLQLSWGLLHQQYCNKNEHFIIIKGPSNHEEILQPIQTILIIISKTLTYKVHDSHQFWGHRWIQL